MIKHFFVLAGFISAFGNSAQLLVREPFAFHHNETQWELAPASKTDAPSDANTRSHTLVTLQSTQSEEKYRARFSIVQDELIQKKDLTAFESYRAHAVDFLKGQRFTIQSEEPIKLRHIDLPAIEIHAHQRDFGLTFRQIIFLHNKKAYLITGSARTKTFAASDLQFQELLDSLTLSKPKHG